MESISGLWIGFQGAFQLGNLLYCFIGVTLGTLIGVLPGLGPTAGIALLIPLTGSLDPTGAIIMLAGIYYGSMYGGSTTAILINTPGEAASAITALDGYEMARQGRAGPALGMAAISSFIAGTFSVVVLTFVAKPLSEIALSFGPAEYFALMMLGLSIVVGLAAQSLRRAFISALIGMLAATIGIDPISGTSRLAFGNADLMGGIDFISVAVGLFAISEVLLNTEAATASLVHSGALKGIWPTRQDWKDSTGAIGRGSVIGFLVGLLPGAGPAVAAFLAYDVERKVSRRPERFGRGAIEGVAAAEGANNSAVGGGLVPMLTLGIPTSAALAVLFGALMIYGLQPGPTLFSQNPQFAWSLIASLYVGNVMLLVLNLPMIGLWARVALVPYQILAPLILISALLGTYAVRNSMFDVWVTLLFGLLGFGMRKLDYPSMPLVLTLLLTPMLETSLRQSLAISQGSLSIFVDRPVAAALLLLAVLSVGLSIWSRHRQSKLTQSLGEINEVQD